MATAAAMAQHEEPADYEVGGFIETAAADLEPRYVVFMGNVITPERVREIPYLHAGGDEHPARTLATTRGFIRRGRLVPLVKWIELVGTDEVINAASLQTIQYQPSKAETVAGQGGVTARSLSGMTRPPGQDVQAITQQDIIQADRKGIVEVTALRGIEYGDPQRAKLEALFFPKAANVLDKTGHALKHAALMAQVETIRGEHKDADVRSIADAMLQSGEMFRMWALRRIDTEALLVRQGVQPSGHVFAYTNLVKSLAELFDVELPDTRIQRAPVGNADTDLVQQLMEENRQMRELMQQQAAENKALMAEFGGIAKQALAATLANAETPKKAK